MKSSLPPTNPQPQPGLPAPNPLNTPQQGQSPAKINGKQIQAYHLLQILQIIEIINQCQAENNLRSLIYFIQMEGQVSKQIVQRASSFELGREWEISEQTEHTRQRCSNIKSRNIRILGRLMNIRLKLVKNMNMYKTRSNTRELEIGHINQKIRGIQSQITYKYNRLKALKVLKRNQKQPNIQTKALPPNMPFDELQKGVQVLEREAIKLKEEMSLLQKYLHNGSI